MAKDEGKKGKGEKPKKGSDDPFANPSEATGGGDGWNLTEEAEDRLLLITPKREGTAETKDYGEKPIIVCDVVVIDEKKPEKSEKHVDVYVFGGYLRGSLREYVGERLVAARIVRGKTKERGNYPWLFEDATAAEKELCSQYLASVDPFKGGGGKKKK